MKGLDQRTVQEILECCYCAPSATADPAWSPSAHFNHTACPTGPHEHPPALLPTSVTPATAAPFPAFDPAGHFGDHTFAAIVSQFPAARLGPPPQPGPFACEWGACRLSFGNKALLVQHVTAVHLDVCVDGPGLGRGGGGPSGFGLVEPLQAWDEGAGLAEQATLSSTPTAHLAGPGGPPDASSSVPPPTTDAVAVPDPATVQQATSTLLKHLIDDHLAKLEPGLAHALGKELQASAETATRLAAPTGARHQQQTSEQRRLAGAADVSGGGADVDADAVSTSSIHTHITADHHSLKPPPHSHYDHNHNHTQHHNHPHPHPHNHSHTHHPNHGPHRYPHNRHHHAHPYGVAARGSSADLAVPSDSATPTPTPDGVHSCKWKGCQLRFETSALLMSHLSLAHVGSGKAGYTCEWVGCDRAGGGDGKGFAQRQKVMRHLQTHTGDRPFECGVCGKSFSEAMTLTQHMRVHTNERPYACTHPGCDKAFALASALTIHVRTHSGDKPFKCPHPGCASAFAESSNLSKHVRTHKGEKGYVCVACGKAFARSDQLARHKKIHGKAKVREAAEEVGKAAGAGEVRMEGVEV